MAPVSSCYLHFEVVGDGVACSRCWGSGACMKEEQVKKKEKEEGRKLHFFTDCSPHSAFFLLTLYLALTDSNA